MITTLQWLGVVPSFGRPHVSDDNPYSEALFRTLKHTPAYPECPLPTQPRVGNGSDTSSTGTTKWTASAPYGS
jgi:transposase InsO family protein